MPGRKAPAESLLARAAELRALGNTWDATGKLMQRSPRTIMKWPQVYPERWGAALEEARRRAICDLSAESLNTLRWLLRDADGKLRRDAATYLSDLRLKQAEFDLDAGAEGQKPSLLALHIERILETFSHEQTRELAATVERIIASGPAKPVHQLAGRAA
jgi:hypothetical protein